MDQKFRTDCPCDVKLPHTADQVRMYSRRAMPTDHYAPEEASSESWARDEAKRVNQIAAAVEDAYSETINLRERITDIEDKIKQVQNKGAVPIHACPISKRFQESLDPKLPDPPNKDKELIKELQKDLEKTKTNCVRHRNQIYLLKEEIKMAKQLLSRELGLAGEMNLREIMSHKQTAGWKGRIQIIKNLQAKVADLEADLWESKQMLRHGPDSGTAATPYEATGNYIVPERQRKTLNKIYSDKEEQIRNLNQQIEFMKQKYKELETLHKSTASRNKILVRELKDLTEKAKYYEAKSKKDKMLANILSKHHDIMKEMLDEQRKIGQLSAIRDNEINELLSSKKNKIDKASDSKTSKAVECEKYKTLWKASEDTTSILEKMVAELQKRLDMVTMQMAEAEKHCCNHRSQLDEFQEQLGHLKQVGKLSAKGKPSKKDYKFMLTDEYLKAVQGENLLLRELLQNAVLDKADDFQMYKTILENTRQEYLTSVQKISEIVNPPAATEDATEEDQS